MAEVMFFLVFFGIPLVVPLISCLLYMGKNKTTKGWDINNTQAIRGAMAIFIVFLHSMGGYCLREGFLCYPYGNEYLIQLRTGVQNSGYLFVAIFFMFGAYGCRKGIEFKDNNYKRSFLLKRIKKVYIPFVIIDTILYLVLKLVQTYYGYTSELTLKNLFSNFIDVNVWPVHWYIIVMMVFYIVFYCIYNSLENVKADIAMIFITCIYLVYSYINGKNEVYYVSCVGIIAGILYFRYEIVIQKLFRKYKILLLLVTTVTFLLIYNYPFIFWVRGYRNIILDKGPIYRMLTAILFCVIVGILAILVDFSKSKILSFLGKISLEIYLVHYCIIICFEMYFGNIKIDNESTLYGTKTLLTLIVTVVFSYVLNQVVSQNLLKGKLKK